MAKALTLLEEAQPRVAAVASREGEDGPRKAYSTWAEKTQAQSRVTAVASREGEDGPRKVYLIRAEETQAQTCVAVLESGVGGDSDSKAIPIRVEVFQEDSRGPTTSLGTTQGTEKLSSAVVTMEKHGHLAEDMKATYRRWKAQGKPKNWKIPGQNREGEIVTNRIKINKRRVLVLQRVLGELPESRAGERAGIQEQIKILREESEALGAGVGWLARGEQSANESPTGLRRTVRGGSVGSRGDNGHLSHVTQ